MATSDLRRRSPSLDDLLRLLRGACGHGEACDCGRPLLSERDLTRLPTYGGAEPRTTSGVWSWDAGRLLVGTCAEDYRIVPRPACRSDGCERVSDVAGSGSGLCATHYQQQRRHGETSPIREAEPAAARIGVRLSATALSALGPRPAARAREVIEEWANGQQPPT